MPFAGRGGAPASAARVHERYRRANRDFGPILLLSGVSLLDGLPHDGGPRDRSSKLTARGVPNGVSFGATGIAADLTVPIVRAAVARQAVYGPALNRLRRLCGDGRTSKVEFIAGNPDAMHDHGKLPSHGGGAALHAPPLGDGDTPGPQPGPLAGTGHQRRCSLVEEVPQHSITALADLPRSVDLTRLIHARRKAEMCPSALEEPKRPGSSTVATNARLVTGPTPGIVIRRRLTSSRRDDAASVRSNAFRSARMPSRTCSNGRLPPTIPAVPPFRAARSRGQQNDCGESSRS